MRRSAPGQGGQQAHIGGDRRRLVDEIGMQPLITGREAIGDIERLCEAADATNGAIPREMAAKDAERLRIARIVTLTLP